MAKGRVERRLAAILVADVAGYSRLMGADEEGTHERLKTLLRQLVDPKIKEHRGRVLKNTGDGMLVEFGSVVDAVRCAVEIQRGMSGRNDDVPPDKRISFRIEVNLGDVIVEPEDIFGDGVNIAARPEALAEPGGICISRVVRDQIRDKLPYRFEDMGERSVKNIARPIRVYRIRLDAEAKAPPTEAPGAVPKSPLPLPDKPSIAVMPFANMSGDPEQEYFADGMVEEIITALSQIRWLFVIARNSTFTRKGQAVDVKEVGRELGVRYVLEGSVRKAGTQVRITGQLIDALTGTHLWAGRFDGSLEDIFELQDRIAVSVAGIIEPTLQMGRDAPLRRAADDRPHRLRSLSARACGLFSSSEGADFRGSGIARAGDRDRSALRASTLLGGDLPYAARHRRLGRRAGDKPPQGHRSCSAGARGGGERPGHPRELRSRAGIFGEDIGAMIG